jgi:hypothetical protein
MTITNTNTPWVELIEIDFRSTKTQEGQRFPLWELRAQKLPGIPATLELPHVNLGVHEH